jgi:hypothetical protein
MLAKPQSDAGKTAADENTAQNTVQKTKIKSFSMPDVSDWSGVIKRVRPNRHKGCF